MSEGVEGRMVGRRYVSNQNESVRMFKDDRLESLSHVHPAIPLVLYVPVVAYHLLRAVRDGLLAGGAIVILFALGMFLWTLTEYVMHRFVFHYEPTSTWGRQLHFIMHGVHHDYPNDATRLVMPPSVSVPLAFLRTRNSTRSCRGMRAKVPMRPRIAGVSREAPGGGKAFYSVEPRYERESSQAPSEDAGRCEPAAGERAGTR